MIHKYLELIRDALKAARSAVREVLATNGAESVGIGYFGDETIRADLVAEEAILNLVKERIPEAYIVSEESGIRTGRGPLVLIDPLDGSTNAKRGIPIYASTIAITSEGGRRYKDIVAAGVIDHVSGEMFWGYSGAVYLNWRPARPSRITDIEESAISFHTQPQKLGDEELARVARLIRKTKYPRMFGSAALETVYVAVGRTEAHVAVYRGLRSFDCLPSLYLVESAGGIVATIDNTLAEYQLDSSERIKFVAASNSHIMNQIVNELALSSRIKYGRRF